MSDDKSKKDGKTEEATEKVDNIKVKKSSSVTVAAGKEEATEKKDEKPKRAPKKTDDKKEIKGLEDLPEDVKKKLEKKKSEVGDKAKSKKKRLVRKKKKAWRRVSVGRAYIKATYNNTIVTLTDTSGNVISWASAGIAGFKGPKKSTPYAAQIITRLAVGRAREEYGLQEVSVFVRGVGTGRESAIRALNNNGLIVTSIKDVTPIPHNGCRARKPRRV